MSWCLIVSFVLIPLCPRCSYIDVQMTGCFWGEVGGMKYQWIRGGYYPNPWSPAPTKSVLNKQISDSFVAASLFGVQMTLCFWGWNTNDPGAASFCHNWDEMFSKYKWQPRFSRYLTPLCPLYIAVQMKCWNVSHCEHIKAETNLYLLLLKNYFTNIFNSQFQD